MELETLAIQLKAEIYIPEHLTFHNIQVKSVQPLDTADEQSISFLTQPKALEMAHQSKAGAILCSEKRQDLNCLQLIHPNPYAAMAKAMHLLAIPRKIIPHLSDNAVVADNVDIHPSCHVHAYVVISSGSHIAQDTEILSHTYIGKNCHIGKNCYIGPNVSIMDDTRIGDSVIIHSGTVIGADGFGFAPSESGITKIPQLGHVVIDDHVEIGANCTIDRATFHQTHIKSHTKLDSQVHIAHNVEIGEMSLICGQSGVAGSTKIGARFIAAGQSAIGQGLELSSGVTLGPRTGVTKSIPSPGEYMGMPAIASKDWMRQAIAAQKLPELLKRVRELENSLQALKDAK